jgi:chorismate synthase
MLRFLTAGESHGKGLTVIMDGFPAGVDIDFELINRNLRMRQSGYGRGERSTRIERDRVEVISGIRGSKTLGSPICINISNLDWKNWEEVMAVEHPFDDSRKITSPRPGHADLPGGMKYHKKDFREILERASARETAIRVVAGSVCECLLRELGINLLSYVVQIGKVKIKIEEIWRKTIDEIEELLKDSRLLCPDRTAEEEMIKTIDKAKESGNTLGGIFEVLGFRVPPGLGSFVQWDKRMDGRIAFALMSIPAVKGVEIGIGFKAAEMLGSEVHDEIFYDQNKGFYRKTNRAGGIEGGVTNGEVLIARAALKPIPTLKRPLTSVDVLTKKETKAVYERSDICVVSAASIIGKCVIAIELTKAIQEKFGSDTIEEIKSAFESYITYVKNY